MQFATTLFSVLTAFAFISNSAYAADICTYGTRSCFQGGTYGCCANIPAGECCSWSSSSLGWSVRFSNMPGGWFGTTYGTQFCTTQTSGIGSSASSGCSSVYTGSTYSNWYSARWNLNGRRTSPEAATSSSECRRPNVLGYTWSNRQYQIEVPEGQYDHITKLLDDGDFDALNRIATEVKA
ncbi:hypothetical protein H1R20_g15036, partial [Candolleomyces eurysporus]